MTNSTMKDKLAKIDLANSLLKFVGDHGRNFFYRDGVYASFEINVEKQNNLLYYRDEYTKKPVYVNRTLEGRRLSNFSHGGTLKGFINELSHFIRYDNYKLCYGCCGMDARQYWSYDSDGIKVVNKAIELGIMKTKENYDNTRVH